MAAPLSIMFVGGPLDGDTHEWIWYSTCLDLPYQGTYTLDVLGPNVIVTASWEPAA